MITFSEWRAARAAIKQLHAPGLRKLANNRRFVRAVVETVRAMQAQHIDASKVLSALARYREGNALA